MEPGQACRLVFSEGDGLSGCTVDRYDRWLTLQLTALGMALRREMLVDLLVELLRPEGIYLRTERGIGQLEGLEAQDGLLWGHVPDGAVSITEGDVRFPGEPGGRAEDGVLPRSARQSAGGGPTGGRAAAFWTPFATPAASDCTRPGPGRRQ